MYDVIILRESNVTDTEKTYLQDNIYFAGRYLARHGKVVGQTLKKQMDTIPSGVRIFHI